MSKSISISISISLLALVACKKSNEADPAPAPHGSAVQPTTQGSAVQSTTSGAGSSSTQWLTLDAIGIEVEAPGCADVTPLTADSVGVGPKDPSCEVPFPGAVFSRTPNYTMKSLDDQVTIMLQETPKPEITHKETTPTGWIIDSQTPATTDLPARVRVLARYNVPELACIGESDAAHAPILRRICASARKKH